MIVVTGCFRRETRWLEPRPGLRVVRTPMGEASAADLDARVEKGLDLSLLVSTGFCGGLDAGMKTGDVFLARAILHRGETLSVPDALVDRARGALDALEFVVWTGTCVSANAVADAGEKRRLAKTGARSVDLESGPLARWAAAHRVPFISCRVVLDPLEAEMPFSGDRPLWRGLLRRPGAALDLARRSAVAGREIGRAVGAVADALREGVR
ncbi:MAG: hypothetical protein PHV11_06880 [Candidatus Bipolaricaulis sp.]|nr:hypothetical protein [Candidatus Bipolaricaulis sp.]